MIRMEAILMTFDDRLASLLLLFAYAGREDHSEAGSREMQSRR